MAAPAVDRCTTEAPSDDDPSRTPTGRPLARLITWTTSPLAGATADGPAVLVARGGVGPALTVAGGVDEAGRGAGAAGDTGAADHADVGDAAGPAGPLAGGLVGARRAVGVGLAVASPHPSGGAGSTGASVPVED
ncbi:hypothetical protein [Micromonospora sp. NPDC051141]|uniref:hypothetical protein n=1 Tax=Micromonospora sp. NPDC051141 TaxID=3364284 RepID=UPI0037BAD53C